MRSAICHFFSHLLFYLLFFVSFLFLQCSYSIGVLGHAGDGLILNLLVPQTTGAAPVSSFNQLQTSCPENRRKREQLLLFLPEGIRFTALA